MNNERIKAISAKLDDNTTIQIETSLPKGEADISDEKLDVKTRLVINFLFK